MFDSLSERLTGIFDTLTGRGALSEGDVDAALREIRVALLEADVALPAVKDFTKRVREKAVGEDVIRSVSPGQQVVKIVHDELVALLGGEGEPEGLSLSGEPPVAILMAGLQGSGKTTTTAKLAKRISEREKKEGSGREPRHAPSRGHGAAGPDGGEGGRGLPAHRGGTVGRGDRQARHERGPSAGL